MLVEHVVYHDVQHRGEFGATASHKEARFPVLWVATEYVGLVREGWEKRGGFIYGEVLEFACLAWGHMENLDTSG